MTNPPGSQDVARPGAVDRLARERPVTLFLILAFGWTWLFWGISILFREPPLFVTSLVLIGGFGPALAAVEMRRWRCGLGFDFSAKRVTGMGLAAAVIFAVISLRYAVGNVPGIRALAPDLTLTVATVLAAVVACLVGGWVISALICDGRQGRGPTLPWFGWTVLALAFYPTMVLISWGMATLLHAPVEYPARWAQPAGQVLPLYGLIFAVTLLIQGGNEEPGWRGFLQPALQTRYSPLVAAILVSLVWSLWHLPLFFNGFYGESELVPGMIGGAVYRVFLAIFLAWFYTRSDSNLFLTCWMHAAFNLMPTFLPTFEPGLVILWLLATAGIVFQDKMWRHVRPITQ